MLSTTLPNLRVLLCPLQAKRETHYNKLINGIY